MRTQSVGSHDARMWSLPRLSAEVRSEAAQGPAGRGRPSWARPLLLGGRLGPQPPLGRQRSGLVGRQCEGGGSRSEKRGCLVEVASTAPTEAASPKIWPSGPHRPVTKYEIAARPSRSRWTVESHVPQPLSLASTGVLT
jgi:hypothetical protein